MTLSRNHCGGYVHPAAGTAEPLGLGRASLFSAAFAGGSDEPSAPGLAMIAIKLALRKRRPGAFPACGRAQPALWRTRFL